MDYQSLREHQTTIFHIISYRYSTLKYLFDEYNKDNKGTYPKFIIDTMHVYKQCIVVDLCKLFIVPNKDLKTNQKCNFYYNLKEHKTFLTEDSFTKIFEILDNSLSEVQQLTFERNKEFAHKDILENPNHRLHLDNLEVIDRLVNHAKTILDILWDSSYDFEEQTNKSVSKIIELIRRDSQGREDELISNLKNKKLNL